MLIVLVVLCILAIGVAVITWAKDTVITFLISISCAIISCIISLIVILICIFGWWDMVTIDDKIKLCQEENKNIEVEITTIVNNFQGYEKEIIENVADIEVLLIKIPELKSSELVNKQIDLYIKNNDKIKELKERKIDTKAVKWLLYFGK